MKFDICTACQFFQPELKTYDKIVPKSCLNPRLAEWFGEVVGGFP